MKKKKKEVLQRLKVEGNIQHKIKLKKNNWIGHILRSICLLKHATEGKTAAMGRSGKGQEQQLMVVKKNK